MAIRLPQPRLFDEFFKEFPFGLTVQPLHGDPLPSPEKIRIDVKENGANVIVHAEVPGVDKKDIDVSVDNGMVTIRAEVRQSESETKDEQVLHAERYFGTVARSFSLPCPVDEAKAKAAYENGVLVLTLPKQSPGSKKKIAIQ